MHLAQIPARVAHQQALEMAEGVRHFEAVRVDGDGAVAAPLGASLGAGEGEPQRRAVRTRSCHIGARQPSGERRLAGFTVDPTVIAELGPGLGGLVEELEREVLHALEHRHQLPLYA